MSRGAGTGVDRVPSAPVYVCGTFDVENYGDCLFPVVAARRLQAQGLTVASASPTAAAVRWTDSPQPEAIAELIRAQTDLAGVLIGGGNIIYNRRVTLGDYVDAGVAETAYPALWLGATLAATLRGRPVVWNAPGVPRSFTEAEQRELIPEVLAAAGYVAVRDDASRAHLGPATADVKVSPDTAVEISRCWPRSSLEPVFRDLLARKNAQGSAGFIAIHIKRRAMEGNAASTAATIDNFARATGMTPVLLALAPCHGDDQVVRELSGHLTSPHLALDDARSLREIAAAIAFSEAYVGSSLHGYITSYSYGRPGVIVARPPMPKFAGFLSHVGREQDLMADWDSAFARATARPEPFTWRAGLQDELDLHWASVGTTLGDHSDAAARGEAYLRGWVAKNTGAGGLAWALAAQLGPPETVTFRRRLKGLVRRLIR